MITIYVLTVISQLDISVDGSVVDDSMLDARLVSLFVFLLYLIIPLSRGEELAS
jgi:hypothetical protein